jgi:hypothetical protein
MGTRAVYTFIHDADERYSVYKHWDGYPSWGCQFIAKALPLAWPLPRFEADEFAAAFVAANKKEAGDIRLTGGPALYRDLAYTYEIRCQDGQLHLRIFKVRYHGPGCCWADYQPLFAGSLEDAQLFAATYN